MAATPPKLTLLPYLQRWDALNKEIHVNLLVVPTGNPFKELGNGLPVADEGPAFKDSKLAFKALLSNNWAQMPGFSEVDTTQVISPTMPLHRESIFTSLKAQFNITQPPMVHERKKEFTIRTHLMNSYQTAFPFVAPKTPLALTDDTYACLLNCPPKEDPNNDPIDDSISWGEAFSFVSRQPKLAREAGFVYEMVISVDPADLLENGGWLFFTLDDSSDYHHLIGTADFLKVFGTKIPALDPNSNHQLFTPVLFPVVDDPTITVLPGSYDEAFLEATRFHDGFAKIVHGSQPINRDPLDESENGKHPIREEGIQLGWDDEDIVIAFNRQMGFEPDGVTEPAEAPCGVAGYRVDVRKTGNTDWNSLSKVKAENFTFGGVNFGNVDWESRNEVYPTTIQDQFWLPSYFARWKGNSLVVKDPDDELLSERPVGSANYYVSEDADKVPLKYGSEYDFRVRMVDSTNGGPELEDSYLLQAEAPTSNIHFKRYVPPAAVNWPEEDPNPKNASITTYTIHRPKIGLPQALYTGYPNVRDELLDILKANQLANPEDTVEPNVVDPDVAEIQIKVWVKAPDFDPRETNDEGYIEWYATTRAFDADILVPYELELAFIDCAKLSDIDISAQTGANPSGSLQLPTARDLRVEIAAIGKNDLNYFGSERARQGKVDFLTLRKEATIEPSIFLPQSPQNIVRSVFLQPTDLEGETQPTAVVLQNKSLPVLVKRLASATQLSVQENSILMPPGQRGVFGCSKGLKHYLPANNSSLVVMSPAELANQWVTVLNWKIDRDWTWNGFAAPSFEISREISLGTDENYGPVENIGQVKMMHAVTPLIAEEAPAERDLSELVFIDAFLPPLGPGGKPEEIYVRYTVLARFENGQTQVKYIENHLPVTTRPTQIPKIVSAGIALSPYEIGEDYASTNTRRKMLWVEFDKKPNDSRDTYFGRVLTQAPDPMLIGAYDPVDETAGYEQWSLNSELVRTVVPGQSGDFAGLTAMQRLIPSENSETRFLIPLPTGTYPDSPELFGFYTYEFRVGHDRGTEDNPFWSTAQGRYGSSIVIEGLQHPSPPLTCNVFRTKMAVMASAPYATPFLNGQNLQAIPPNTQLWFTLYAQVMQADGKTMRNIELDKRLGRMYDESDFEELQSVGITEAIAANIMPLGVNRQKAQNLHAPIEGNVKWNQFEISQLLQLMGLDSNTPTSILAIELLPEPNGRFDDPLGANLGEVRILRTSALYATDSLCCV
ncbi:MAG: hypothetical protein Crog4KO_08610 [Crocinitomicaceae bacterium]